MCYKCYKCYKTQRSTPITPITPISLIALITLITPITPITPIYSYTPTLRHQPPSPTTTKKTPAPCGTGVRYWIPYSITPTCKEHGTRSAT